MSFEYKDNAVKTFDYKVNLLILYKFSFQKFL